MDDLTTTPARPLTKHPGGFHRVLGEKLRGLVEFCVAREQCCGQVAFVDDVGQKGTVHHLYTPLKSLLIFLAFRPILNDLERCC